VVLALNMTDDLHKDGAKIDLNSLSELLGGIPVISTTANQGKGISDLISKAVLAARKN
jgi:Fe2+ transport system protein B